MGGLLPFPRTDASLYAVRNRSTNSHHKLPGLALLPGSTFCERGGLKSRNILLATASSRVAGVWASSTSTMRRKPGTVLHENG